MSSIRLARSSGTLVVLRLLLTVSVTGCSDEQSPPSPYAGVGGVTSPETSGSVGTTAEPSTAGITANASSNSGGVSGSGSSQANTTSQSGTAQGGMTMQSATSQGGASGNSGDISGSSDGMNASGGTAGTDPVGSGGGAAVSASTGGADAECPPGSIVCDGFEDYPSGDSPGGAWSASARGSGTIEVDTERAFSGNHSLHVSGQLSADHANITTPIQDSAVVHVRFMMYTVSYPASSGVHTRLARLGLSTAANGAPYSAYALATYNGTAIEKVNSIYLRDTGTHMDDANLKDRWVCWEFSIDKTGGEGNVEVHLWVDGRDLPLSPAGSSSHGMTSATWDPITFEMFMLGLDGFQNDSQRADFWIDDLLVTSERVGCPIPE